MRRVPIQDDRSQPVAHPRTAGVPARDDVEPVLAEPGREPGGLGCLPPPSGPSSARNKPGMGMGPRKNSSRIRSLIVALLLTIRSS